MKTSAAIAAAAVFLISGCGGGSMPSRQHVEHEVSRQARATVTDNAGQEVTPITHCAESVGSSRIYACTVAVKVGSGAYTATTRPQHVRATVSKDGKVIVVSGLSGG